MTVIINDLKVCICTMMFHSYKATIQMYFDGLVRRWILLFLFLLIMIRWLGETIELIIWFPEFISHYFEENTFLRTNSIEVQDSLSPPEALCIDCQRSFGVFEALLIL